MFCLPRLIALALLSAFALTASGCLAAAAAAGAGGTVAYMRGDLEATVQAGPRDVAAAAETALNEMGINVLSSSSDDTGGTITARNAQDKKITIEINRLNESASTISIRVGMFGDEALSRAIYERVKASL